MKQVRKRKANIQIWYDIIYTWNLKNDTNELIYKTKRLTNRENKFIVTKGKKG